MFGIYINDLCNVKKVVTSDLKLLFWDNLEQMGMLPGLLSPDFTVRTVSPEHFLWSKVPHELQRVPI